MSLEIIRNSLSRATTISNWKFYACKYKLQSNNTMEYSCCDVNFHNSSDLNEIVAAISTSYNRDKLSKMEAVRDYSGFNGENIISKLTVEHEMISEVYSSIMHSAASSSDATNINDFDYNSYIIQGSYKNTEQRDVYITFITLRSPFRKFKRAFSHHNNTFKPYTGNLLQITDHFDILIIDYVLYLFSFNGESILNLERSYKTKCREDLITICDQDILSNAEEFSKIAQAYHNPRKFITFQPSKLEYLKDEECRLKISSRFDIPLDESKKFNVSEKTHVERLIKFLCNKAKTDPVDDSACEVQVAFPWS